MSRRRRLPLVLGVLALLVGMAPGQPGGGGSPGCVKGNRFSADSTRTPGAFIKVRSEIGVTCPTPEAGPSTSSFGPTTAPRVALPAIGSDCVVRVDEPLQFSLTPGGQFLVFWVDPQFNGNGSDTPEPQDPSRFLSGMSAEQFFMQGGSTDFWVPYTLRGKIDASRNCVPKDPNDPIASFTSDCNFATAPFPACLVRSDDGPVDGGGLPLGAIPGGLAGLIAQMEQRIVPGHISSMPAQPAPGLVNTGTCFFVDGVNIAGEDAVQGATFEVAVLGPPDASRRQIYYVFRLQMHLDGITWNFGDGSTEVDPQLPEPCRGRASTPQTLAFSHTYRRYSDAPGFPVSASESFVIDATEYWVDARATHGPQNAGRLTATALPGGQPFVKTIVQEEGVPIGGG